VRQFIVGTVVTAIAFYILTRFLPEFVSYGGELPGLLVIAAIFGVVNSLIGPGIKVTAVPLSLVTLGVIGFLINAGLLLVTALIADTLGFDMSVGGFPPTFGIDAVIGAVVGSIVLSLVSSIVGMVVPSG
jgi:putative membrane protein